MSDESILSMWSDAKIQILDNYWISGVLKFFVKSGTYFFTWKSEDFIEMQNVYIFLHQISSIQIKPLSISRTGLVFVFKDYNSFPLISFSALAAQYLIAFLEAKGIVSSNRGKCTVCSPGRILPNLPNGFIHSSRFISLVNHYKILTKIINYDNKESMQLDNLTKEDTDAFFDEEGKIKNYEEMVEKVQKNGLDEYSRTKIWPFLLHVYPSTSTISERAEINAKNLKLYKNLDQTKANFTRKQNKKFNSTLEAMEKNLNALQAKEKFNDSTKEMIRNILIRYSILCTNIGYKKTMESIVFILYYAFLKKIDEKQSIVTMNDDISLGKEEFCAFILACFRGFLNLGSRFRLYENGNETQKFFSERVYKIIEITHNQLHCWLSLFGLSNAMFLYEYACCGFANIIAKERLVKLWDISFSSPHNECFFIFFSVSITILLYGDLFLKSTLEENTFISEFEVLAKTVDIQKSIIVTKNIIKQMQSRGTDTAWMFIPLKTNKELLNYKPKYITIK